MDKRLYDKVVKLIEPLLGEGYFLQQGAFQLEAGRRCIHGMLLQATGYDSTDPCVLKHDNFKYREGVNKLAAQGIDVYALESGFEGWNPLSDRGFMRQYNVGAAIARDFCRSKSAKCE